MTTYRPRLLVDFDGVLHGYSRGWDDGTAYDGPISGAREALADLVEEGYEVVVFSTRDAEQIVEWLSRYDFPPYRVTNAKEPAVALIDDRAVRFIDWTQALAETRERYPVRK